MGRKALVVLVNGVPPLITNRNDLNSRINGYNLGFDVPIN